MKINKLFHWLYFTVIMLPIFAIPIFAIYTRNENSTFAQSVTIGEQIVEEMTYNQLVYNGGDFTDTNYIDSISANITLDNGYVCFSTDDYDDQLYFAIDNSIFEQDDRFLIKFTYYFEDRDYNLIDWNGKSVEIVGDTHPYTDYYLYDLDTRYITPHTITSYADELYNDSFDQIVINFAPFDANTFENLEVPAKIYFKNVMLFDVTKIYGVGNEPSIEQFNIDFPNDYYSYGIDVFWKNVVIQDYDAVYDDTDVGSQYVYMIYNVINQYFNFDYAFNFGYLYTWIQTNFFNGFVSLGFFIFWHLLIYWLLTSLLWLLFDVLIYVPMLVHRWLDKASLS